MQGHANEITLMETATYDTMTEVPNATKCFYQKIKLIPHCLSMKYIAVNKAYRGLAFFFMWFYANMHCL